MNVHLNAKYVNECVGGNIYANLHKHTLCTDLEDTSLIDAISLRFFLLVELVFSFT